MRSKNQAQNQFSRRHGYFSVRPPVHITNGKEVATCAALHAVASITPAIISAGTVEEKSEFVSRQCHGAQ